MMRKLKNRELNRLSVDEFKKAEKSPFVVVLDDIRSLNNIGSIFRTSDAFRIDCIYLCGITAQPPHKDIHKTALGATESVDWVYFQNCIDAIKYLKTQNYKIVSIEQAVNSVNLESFDIEIDTKYAFVLGNEVKGVQQSVVDDSDFCVEIPQFGTKHSFNVSVSTGIVLWEVFRKYMKINEF